jgi:hypothetical protein
MTETRDMRPSAVLARALARLGPNGENVVRNADHCGEDDGGRKRPVDVATRFCIWGALRRETTASDGDLIRLRFMNALPRSAPAITADFIAGRIAFSEIERLFVVAIGMAHADEQDEALKVAPEPAHAR